MHRKATLVAVTLALSLPALAQSGAALRKQSLVPVDGLAVVELPPIDLVAVAKEDAGRLAKGEPPRFAIPHEVAITPFDHGTWEDLDATTLIWRLRIRALGAASLNLGFESYWLPEGAALALYSPDGQHVVRPFTSDDNEAHGELWTPIVASDDLIVELTVPSSVLDDVRLGLSSINYGYRGFGTLAVPIESGACNVDVICAQGDGWRLEIPSVGVISTGGSTFCTGFLVNNTAVDLKPFFMTALHCGITSGNAASLVVYWNYENSTCRVPGSGASGGPGDGRLTQFNTGSFFRSSYSPSDFTLVELDDQPNPAFSLSYAGWDATGADAAMAIAIHHPNTDEKRISFENDPTTTTTYLQESVPGDGTHVRVIDWDLGTTEPGSSGSPLFNQSHRVIGQLHGGFASCTSQTSDWYGKFSRSWTGGGTNSSRLSNWLDSGASGALVIDTVSLDTLCYDAGTVAFERSSFACADSAVIEVVDCGLNLDDELVEITRILVTSATEPTGEVVTLTETGRRTGRFTGSLAISTTNASGVLHVTAGEQIVASYTDADDGAGGFNVVVTDQATIDCTRPLVLAVDAVGVEARRATIEVTADEPIGATVFFGTSCGSLPGVASSTGLATTARVALSGLLPNTLYHYRVLASDEAGNDVNDPPGVGCHTFLTPDVQDFLTEEFTTGTADLDRVQFVFEPDGSLDFYSVCRSPSPTLPTRTTGSTVLSMTDDDSKLVSLSGGRTVSLYGVRYSSFFVGSNGYITFGSSDRDYDESLSEHFSRPRVALAYDDFNPSAGGQVSWRQLSDRVIVTWLNVPEFNTSNQNTFQATLFFDGKIMIAYGNVASTDHIVGLSAGTGLDPAFVELDYSDAQRCVRELASR